MEKNPNHTITDYFKLTELGQGTYGNVCKINKYIIQKKNKKIIFFSIK